MAQDPSPANDPLDATLRAFVRRHRIPEDAIRSGGRVVVTIDGRHHVTMCGASHNRLVMMADLIALPEHARESQLDAVLLRLARHAAGLLKDHTATLCIDRGREQLMLQQVVPPGADLAALEAAFGEFANSVDFWKDICRADVAALAGAFA